MSTEQQLRRRVCELTEVLKYIRRTLVCYPWPAYEEILSKTQGVLAGAANSCPHEDELAEARSLLDRAECTDKYLRQMIGQLHFCLVGPWQGCADAVGYLLDKAQKEYAGLPIPRLEEPTPEWVAEFGRRCQATIPDAVFEGGRWKQGVEKGDE
jgi:hypothetical protein